MALTKITADVIENGAITSDKLASGAVSAASLSSITTDNVSEGSTNVYYTDTRARGSVSVTGGNLSYDSGTGVIQLTTDTIRGAISVTDAGGDGSLAYSAGVITYTGPSAAETRAHFSGSTGVSYNSSTGAFTTSAIPNSSLSNSSITINSNSVDLGASVTLDTDDVGEGSTNLYYTDARVDSRLASGSVGNIVTTGYIAGPATFTIDPAAVGDNTGTVVIAGDLRVDGTTTTINSTTLTVDDKNILLGQGAALASDNNGAGITVDTANASITYDSTNDEWDFNKDISVVGINNLNTIDSSGSLTLTVDDADFIIADSTDTPANFIWRDHSDSKLYLGTSSAVATLRSTLDLNSNNITNAGTISSGAITSSDNQAQNFDINFVNTRGNTADRVRLNLEANSEDWHIENDQNLASFKIRHHTNDNDVLIFNNTARANSITANSTGVGINVASAAADLHVDRVIRVTGTTSAVQIGDTNGYTFFYTGNSSNRLQLNYDSPFGSGQNILFTADSSGRVVYHDQLQLAADYATASGNSLATNSYFYVGSVSKNYNVAIESSRDITSSDGQWAAQNELFIVNTHSGGEASIGMSALNAGGQHHRVALIAQPEGTGSLGSFVIKTRGTSAIETERERLKVFSDGSVDIKPTKAYGATSASLRISGYMTGTNYSDGSHLNVVFGNEVTTNAYLGEIRVEQLNPSASTETKMEFYTNSGGGNTATKPRMTIMGNGGVEIGDGTNYGYLKVITNNAVSAVFDRRNGDGSLILFRNDDSTDGQINTLSGRIGIGSDDTGIFFDSVRDCVSPFSMSTNDGRGSAIDLGRDAVRFRAGYFSGQVNASTLTATNTANSAGLSFRSGYEFISGEGWCTAHGHYNYNDGTLFLNRNTSDGLHPVFHVGGYNNPTYHPSFSYGNGDAGMVTLVRPNGTKSEGSTYAYRGLSDSGDYSNWIKDSSGTWFFDSDGKHQFYGNVDVRQSLAVNSDKAGNEYLYLWQAQGGDGGILFGDATGGSRLNWQVVPNTSSRDLQFYSYTAAAQSVKFNAAGGIWSLRDGGTSSAFFLAGNSAAAANGKVAMGLRDGMIQFRDPLDYFHKMWYYDGVNVSTNSSHGHFRVYGDSDNSAMNNSSIENLLRLSVDTVNGNIGTTEGGSNIYSSSDERLKTNIQNLPSMLDKINQLRPVSFDWKYTAEEEFLYGFIAQEVQSVDSSLVFDNGDTPYCIDKIYQDGKEPDGVIENTLAIYERQLIPMLVKALQEADAKIESLTSRIEALEE